ncbi:hypothetical protein WA158_007796 [Blastocystis sp. Blastoise]
MTDNQSVLTVLDKRELIVPCLDKKQLNSIAHVVDKYKHILGYQWTPDAKRIVKRTDYDVKETTFLTTIACITPMIFIKWLTLWKRVGLSVGAGIPIGYLIGQHDRKRGLTNLCDSTDQEIGRKLRESIFLKGHDSVASRYLIARGYGGLSYPASQGNINHVTITDDYERSGKAYTKLVYVEGELEDVVGILNHITVRDMRSFGLKGHLTGVEGTIIPWNKHYKATIKVHSVPKKANQKEIKNIQKEEEIKNKENNRGIENQMESFFISRKDENDLIQAEIERIKKEVLKSTIEEVTAKELKDIHQRVVDKTYGKKNIYNQIKKSINHQPTKEEIEQAEQIALEKGYAYNKNAMIQKDSDPIQRDLSKNTLTTATLEREIEEKEEEEEEDFDYLYEDLIGTIVPPETEIHTKQEDPEFFDPIFEDVLGTPLPPSSPLTEDNVDTSDYYSWKDNEEEHSKINTNTVSIEGHQQQHFEGLPKMTHAMSESNFQSNSNERNNNLSSINNKVLKE